MEFHELIYEHIDAGDSPYRIWEWPTEKLELLRSLVDGELQRRAVTESGGP